MKFTAEDFTYPVGLSYLEAHQRIADQANAKLEEWLENAPRIFHRCRTNYICTHEKGLWSAASKGKKYKAKLVCLEEQ